MPASKIAGVNFSCGYYNAHTLNEYVVLEEMEATQKMVCGLLEKTAPQQFEFIEKKYSNFNYSGNYGSGYGGYRNVSWYDNYDVDDLYGRAQSINVTKKDNNTKSTSKKKVVSDKWVYLTVEVDEDIYGISELQTKGETKAECWMNLFMEYDDLCYSYIVDYYYE